MIKLIDIYDKFVGIWDSFENRLLLNMEHDEQAGI